MLYVILTIIALILIQKKLEKSHKKIAQAIFYLMIAFCGAYTVYYSFVFFSNSEFMYFNSKWLGMFMIVILYFSLAINLFQRFKKRNDPPPASCGVAELKRLQEKARALKNEPPN